MRVGVQDVWVVASGILEEVFGGPWGGAEDIREPGHDTSNQTSALSTQSTPSQRCTNPGCKARNRSSHCLETCYWPGGGKEGQFPPNFGRQSRASMASTPSTSNASVAYAPHYALVASTSACGFDWSDEPCGIEVQRIEEFEDEDALTTHVTIEDCPNEIEESLAHVTIAQPTSGAPLDSAFTDYREIPIQYGHAAQAGDGFPIVGRGSVTRNIFTNGKRACVTFKNVLHALSLASDLLSVSQLDKAGCKTVFGLNRAVVSKDNHSLFGASVQDGMYVVGMEPLPAAFLSTNSPVSLCQWHCRLAHGSPDTICIMSDKDLVDGLTITSWEVPGKCIDCILARQTTHPYDKPSNLNVDPLELVAIDLLGPSRVPTAAGNKYMIVISDSGSGTHGGEFLKDKGDATTIPAFDEYRIRAKAESGKKICTVISDNSFNTET
ncbi:hypothetical protein C8R41DRAFT_925122 [Lentinula lateritia]|uniref:GAG-pre-integrase domain-containing protein n=1 Tax=Lentinula lateritia TaxID=40482 RepID=A0ABQ8V3V5_9AGAR|nr:hypothetical protein C8R41DRAFT_925122 [Lentinula lateritia]